HAEPGDPHRQGPTWRRAVADVAPPRRADPPMIETTVVLVVLTAAGFPLLLWAIGRMVTAMAERVSCSHGRKQYLAGRPDGVRITALIDGGDELLVSLTPQPPISPWPPAGRWM